MVVSCGPHILQEPDSSAGPAILRSIMSEDALDRVGVGRKRLSKAEKIEYAINKQEEEIRSVLNDPAQTKKISKQFKDHVAKERKRLGLT